MKNAKKAAALVIAMALFLSGSLIKAEDAAVADATTQATESSKRQEGKGGRGAREQGTPPSGEMPQGTPPSGEMPQGTPPSGETPQGTPPSGEIGAPPSGGGFAGNGEITQGTAATTIDSDQTAVGESYSTTQENENSLRIAGAVTVVLNDIEVAKSGNTENTEDSDFYGENAALLATDGASVTITGATVNTDASGANAVFSYGEGTNVVISDADISTAQNNSGGIHVAGGGTLTASGLTVETQGNSAAAIRSDRGGGTLVADGGRYVTHGTGSPAIYSTADITVKNATLVANHSEAIVVEGMNSVALEDCDVTGNMAGTYAGDDDENIHNVMIYQSMSGDAAVGGSAFSMTGGSLTALEGDLFYVTNTACSIALNGVALTGATENLLVVEGNSSARGWGVEGNNGGQAVFTADQQKMAGIIRVDEISTLDLALANGTVYTGAINPDGAAGTVNVSLDDSAVWILTADSYVASFSGSTDQLTAEGYHLYANGEQII